MGNHGLKKTLGGRRIAALAFVCAAMAALLGEGGLLAAPAGDNTLPAISLKCEVVPNEKGEPARIRVTGANVPLELRKQYVSVTAYYNDNVDSNGNPMPGPHGRVIVGDDGTFTVELAFEAGTQVANGFWSAKAQILGTGSVVRAAGEVKRFLIGNAAVQQQQQAEQRAWLLRWAQLFKDVRAQAILRHDNLKKAGLVDAKFADGRNREADVRMLDYAGLAPNELTELIAKREELPQVLVDFLRFVFSKEGQKVIGDAGVGPVKFALCDADAKQIGILIIPPPPEETAPPEGAAGGEPPADAPAPPPAPEPEPGPPDFPPYTVSIQPSAPVKIVTSDFVKGIVDEIGKAYSANYKGVVTDVKSADAVGDITAMKESKADVLIINRRLSAAELAAIADKRGLEPVPVRLASLGGIAIIVNKANPLRGISLEEIDAVYSTTRNAGRTEDIADWGKLGVGDAALKDKPITLVGIAADTPAAGIFRECALLGGKMKGGATLAADAAGVIAAVGKDPTAIGFVRVEDVAKVPPDVRVIPVSAVQWGRFVEPSPDNIAAGAYPLTAFLYAHVVYDRGWKAWRREKENEINTRVADIMSRRPKINPDLNGEVLQYLGLVRPQLANLMEQLRYDLMGVNRRAEMLIAMVNRELMSTAPKMTPQEARVRTLQKGGDLAAIRKAVAENMPKDMSAAEQGFAAAMNEVLVRLRYTRNVTVADLFLDVVRMHACYWALCEEYQKGLVQFQLQAGQVWAATWVDSLAALKDEAAKYVPNDDTARNIGRDRPKIKEQIEAFAAELDKLRWAFLKDLQAKHPGGPAIEGIPADVKAKEQHAAAAKNIYAELCKIVVDERQKYLPPLVQSFQTLQGKFQALNGYMAPLMPTSGRAPASLDKVKEWLKTWTAELDKELGDMNMRALDRNFTDVFPDVALYMKSPIIDELKILAERYTVAVTLGDDKKEDRDTALKHVADYKDALSKAFETLRTRIEGRFDVESRQIYAPGEKGYEDWSKGVKTPAP